MLPPHGTHSSRLLGANVRQQQCQMSLQTSGAEQAPENARESSEVHDGVTVNKIRARDLNVRASSQKEFTDKRTSIAPYSTCELVIIGPPGLGTAMFKDAMNSKRNEQRLGGRVGRGQACVCNVAISNHTTDEGTVERKCIVSYLRGCVAPGVEKQDGPGETVPVDSKEDT